ncbi:NnrU family protein [Sphingomicrobium sp. XHP0239]|uniref:NnrU family protein n=1 Tax=Sphingomicrobium maritimum TaxID=3133972 RepID=UPI0031CC79E5
MNALGWLAFWSVAFAATHLAMSHPLRTPMVRMLGEKGFSAVYSIVSLVTLVMAARSYGPAQIDAAWLWGVSVPMWGVGSLLMWIGSIAFVGSLVKNPALPHPDADAYAARPATGVFATTRHPMMWGFALWGVTHILVNPTWPSIVLSLAIIVTALGGAWGQDIKKRRLMGESWSEWEANTSYFPFARGFHAPGMFALIGGTILFFVATYAHGWLGRAPVGLWTWF